MLLKLLGDDGLFTILARVRSVEFRREAGKPMAHVTFEPGSDTEPTTRAYSITKSAFVLSESGTTLDVFRA